MTNYRAERDERLIDTIGKLLAKAAGTKNEIERELFHSKAMSMIAENNLDMAAIEVGGNGAKAAKRTDEKFKGGLYQWQRELWKAIADLNFCMYFYVYAYDPDKISKYWSKKFGGKANVPDRYRGGYRYEHRLVGRTVNVTLTQTMADYLQGAIERELKNELNHRGEHLYSEYANGFRTGAADEVIAKLIRKRREMEEDERAKEMQREAELRAKGAEGFSSGKAVTLSSVKETEKAANYDMVHGEGKYAEMKARQSAVAERIRLAEQEYTKWALENPEEAKKQAEAAEKAERKRWRSSWNAGMGKTKYNKSGYNAGANAGERISIDQQVKSGMGGLIK